MEVLQELVKLAIGTVWAAVFGAFLWWYFTPLSKLIESLTNFVQSLADREWEAGAKGVKMSRPQQTLANATAATEQGLAPTASVTPTAETASGPIAKRFDGPFQDYTTLVEEKLDEVLSHLMQQLNLSREQTIKYVAIDHLAALRLERPSRGIYGSQIEAINVLDKTGGKLPVDGLRSIYNTAVTNFPDIYKNYTFEQWLTYLATWELIRIDGLDAIITPAGKAIIPYMQKWNYLTPWPRG